MRNVQLTTLSSDDRNEILGVLIIVELLSPLRHFISESGIEVAASASLTNLRDWCGLFIRTLL